MKKRLVQNQVAQSKLALPVCMLFATVIWLLCGLVQQQWWLQFFCFAATTYLIMLLNNLNALIRIYSRMVSCSFLLLSCACCFLFPSIRGAIMQMGIVAMYTILFLCYQDRESAGKTFYAFVCFGIATMGHASLLFFLPLIWLLMGTNLLMLSWRTWGASILGTLTPYWFAVCGMLWMGDITPLADHLATLTDIQFPVNYTRLSIGFMLVIALIIVCAITGIIHYLNKTYQDSVRIRLIYGFFIWMDLLAFTMVCLQPQHQDMLLRMLIINTAPLISHFLALTATKATNQGFYMLVAATVAVIIYNVWMLSSLF